MITDEMIKTEFIHQTVSRDMKRIYATQEEVVRTYLNGGTGKLADYLSKAPYSLELDSGLFKTYYVKVLSYLRYLDIKYRKQNMETRSKLALYNRVIWGVLYNETLPDLRYGFTQEISRKIGRELRGIEENKSQGTLDFGE